MARRVDRLIHALLRLVYRGVPDPAFMHPPMIVVELPVTFGQLDVLWTDDIRDDIERLRDESIVLGISWGHPQRSWSHTGVDLDPLPLLVAGMWVDPEVMKPRDEIWPAVAKYTDGRYDGRILDAVVESLAPDLWRAVGLWAVVAVRHWCQHHAGKRPPGRYRYRWDADGPRLLVDASHGDSWSPPDWQTVESLHGLISTEVGRG